MSTPADPEPTGPLPLAAQAPQPTVSPQPAAPRPESSDACSLLLPAIFRRLSDPAISTVMLCGCGGGFDFVHGVALMPELMRLGKRVVIGAYSFGLPEEISGEGAVTVFDGGNGALAKRVTAKCIGPKHYSPEIHVCSFLDACFPEHAPHSVYAYYARAFTVPLLRRLYSQLVSEHAVDAVILVDGGSDSLMVGDEAGLGDPIEDAVSIQAVALLGSGTGVVGSTAARRAGGHSCSGAGGGQRGGTPSSAPSSSGVPGDAGSSGAPSASANAIGSVASRAGGRSTCGAPSGGAERELLLKALVCIGVGADRHNDVSDASTLRAIAELTARGAFLGAVSLEPSGAAMQCYRECVEHVNSRQGFRSVLSGCILAAAEGGHGFHVPPVLQASGRGIRPGDTYLWPLMPVLWAFDIAGVACRSRICQWIGRCESVPAMHAALKSGRERLSRVRAVEELPRHADMSLFRRDERSGSASFLAEVRARLEEDAACGGSAGGGGDDDGSEEDLM